MILAENWFVWLLKPNKQLLIQNFSTLTLRVVRTRGRGDGELKFKFKPPSQIQCVVLTGKLVILTYGMY